MECQVDRRRETGRYCSDTDVGYLSRVDNSEGNAGSLISMYIWIEELPLFPFTFGMECERKRGDKGNVKISAGMERLQKESLGEVKEFNLGRVLFETSKRFISGDFNRHLNICL